VIKLKQPALILHACDLDRVQTTAKMWASWDMPKGMRPSDVVSWILYCRNSTPDLMLPNVVINSHGSDGEVYVGGRSTLAPGIFAHDSINIFTVSVFSQLRGKEIGTIWLHSCEVANTIRGWNLCEAIARESGCNVVAGETTQSITGGEAYKLRFNKGCLDDYEGRTLWFSPSGKVYQVGNNGSGVPTVD
jgi:hypothetical protein